MAIRQDRGSWCVYWNEAGKRKTRYFGSGAVAKRKAERFNQKKGFGVQKRGEESAVPFEGFLTEYMKHLQARTTQTNLKNTEWKFIGCILPVFRKRGQAICQGRHWPKIGVDETASTACYYPSSATR